PPVTPSAPRVAASAIPPPEPQTRVALDHPADAYPVIWVRRGRQVEIRTAAGGGELVNRAGKRTEFGSPTVFGVVRRSGGWAGVSTPLLPNNRLGWIRLDRRRLRAGWTRLSIVVDLSERRAELRRGSAVRRAFAVTIGAPGTETPTGRFAVTDKLRGGLNPAYGCCALALSATQPNAPSGWLGGRRIAIHGTSGALGLAASLGCVRAADADVSELVSRVPLGTPVFIRG
ncbi:MAG: L,D-transpeptidase, partial [Solirubrobacterales bacterium]